MKPITRRKFIVSSALTLGALSTVSLAARSMHSKSAKLCFSTLGCPGWDLEQTLDFAAQHKYNGIEFRGIKGELDLPKNSHFSPANINTTIQMLKDKSLEVVGLGSSAQMHHQEPEAKLKHMGEAKGYIDLAEKLNCRFVRVFPEKLQKGDEKKRSMDTIVENLLTLAEYAKGSKVTVLLESHGELVYASDLAEVMSRAKHKQIGMIWDIMNMWTVTQETPADVYNKLAPYIRHVHVKDGVRSDNKINYVLLGKGEAPIKEAVTLLRKGNYDGYYSFEWEKLWHPEIAEPEVAFAHYPQEIRKYLDVK